ncbi:MAG: helix-turn-helix domain-containing protein [Armatimonadetes bacterium]|nr:helix-turn-helix domain-containing protein [Armatimonadota bacterium]
MGPLLTDAGVIRVKRYEPNRFMPSHRHGFDKVSFMLSGSVKERHGADETFAEAGWAVVKPADVLHEDEFGPRGLCTLTLLASPQSPEVTEAWNSLVSDYRWMPIDRCVGRLVRLWFDRIEGASPVIEEVVLSLAGEVDRAVELEHRAPWFRKALAELDENFREPPSLTDLAEAVAVHPVTLSKQFRSHGTSKSEYVHRLRVQHAMKDLSLDRSLTCIAEANGYSDLAHFSRSFKHWVGCTPKLYRKSFSAKG